ncbi:MAG: para-nitrobenzyl esterase [Gammaproteobacteria bacterium]|jgi:para-nitrobenzyl esterase|nr:para-nitrobenzyl esterase [Gammaproteobacteria bacterium]
MSVISRAAASLATLVLLVARAGSAHAAIEIADVTGGRLKGEMAQGIALFKGVPFAAPPVGTLRWKAPQPVIPWSGTRDASTFAPACVQPWNAEPKPISEDCLYLNVWTAAAMSKERRPVMVWIHGGGFKGGMSWEELSNGSKLAPEGVVLVTIAYRLGAMGFLAHPDLTRESGKSSGNYGLLDIVAALKWVRTNIAQFGGDPSRVTIFGGSAGGIAVSLLAGAPAAKGLYERAIAQGGVAFYPLPSLKEAETEGEALFKSVGVADLKSAREIPAATLNGAREKSSQPLPIIDGDLIPRDNIYLFKHGLFNDTPILVGFTSAEWGDPSPPTAAAWLRARIAGLPCKDTHAAIEAAYPFANDDEAKLATRHSFRDLGTGLPTWKWAQLQTTKGHHPAYMYYFDVHGPEHPFGAWHAAEYPYVFGNFPKLPTTIDAATSALIRKYWINFAAHGDPNGPGLPAWKAFDERSQAALVFGDSAVSRQLPDSEGIEAWDALLRCAPLSAEKFLFEKDL